MDSIVPEITGRQMTIAKHQPEYGQPLLFEPLYEAKRGLIGYGYQCPNGNHRARNWIDTESGTRHHLERDADGRVTIRGSLLCSQGCGWHVMIERGIARDA
jgi:hypothetical protein